MTGSHLSDEKIQSYLDNRISKTEKNLIEKHLRLCSECTVKLENYELIFNELNQELNVDLNENFSEKLISRIR
ncbi:MAG: zf-HC2 domain-containing protein, partial [bacterium]|nr:zf-HC2 domain-containing protein [bacterium]